MAWNNCVVGTLTRGWFGLVLGLSLCVAALVCKLLMLCPCGASKAAREGAAVGVLQAALRLSLLCCPWIRVEKEDWTDDTWARLAEPDVEGRPVFLLSNHTSFLDTMVAVAAMPRAVAVRSRMYMSDHLYGLPLMGTCIRAAGHFPIQYKSMKEGAFTVDRAAVAAVDVRVDEHVTSGGGVLCFFPEGAMNKDLAHLLPFRFGGMKRALKYDARIYHLTTVGCPDVWPRQAYVGGFPGTVRIGLEAVAPSSCSVLGAKLRSEFADGAKSPPVATPLSQAEQEQKDAEMLASHLHTTMQKHWQRLSDQRGEGCCCRVCSGGEKKAQEGAAESLLSSSSPPNSPPASPMRREA